MKKLPLAKKKKVSKTYLKKKADRLFSLKVRAIGKCELRGLDHIECNGNLQTMHIVGRGNMRLRYDEMNVLCGCAAHHYWYTIHPWEWQEFIRDRFTSRYEYLNKVRNEVVKADYYEVIEKYK